MDGRSFVGENDKSQFQRNSNLTFSNINLSDPKSGRVSFTAIGPSVLSSIERASRRIKWARRA
jgi:hypothetical protein